MKISSLWQAFLSLIGFIFVFIFTIRNFNGDLVFLMGEMAGVLALALMVVIILSRKKKEETEKAFYKTSLFWRNLFLAGIIWRLVQFGASF